MPKVRQIEYSFLDVQRHLGVGRSRIIKIEGDIQKRNNILARIDDAMRLVQGITKDVIALNEEQENSQVFLERTITNEIDLIKKEAKKNIQKIDYHSAIPAIYNATTGAQAMNIGIQYGIELNKLKEIVKLAPPHTNLGKAIARLKPMTIPSTPEPKQKPIPAALQFDIDEEEQNENNTINSDNDIPSIDDELMAKLKGN